MRYSGVQDIGAFGGSFAQAAMDESAYKDPRETAEFQALDSLIKSYIHSIPREFKDPFQQGPGSKVDPGLYTALLLPWV